jgi:type I restriction enzyme S subunit
MLAIYGATTGKTAVLRERSCVNQAILGMYEPREGVNSRFVKYVLEDCQEHIRSLARGNAQPNVSMGIMRNYFLPVPDFDVQERIADVLWNIDEKIAQLRTRKARLNQVKHGLMQDLLSGEVRTPESLSVRDEVAKA